MATPTDAQEYLQILDTFEEEYRLDLGIHLYSTFLLHRLNHLFPRKHWASWPLPKHEVPDAPYAKRYEDVIVEDTFETNNALLGSFQTEAGASEETILAATNGAKSTKSVKELYDETQMAPEDTGTEPVPPLTDKVLESDESDYENGLQSSFQDPLSDDSDTELPEDPALSETVRVLALATEERMANPKATLINEIGALIERKIHQRLQKKKAQAAISTDIYSSRVTKELSKKVANKTSRLMGSFIRQSEQLISRQLQRVYNHLHRQLFSWHDILLANLENEAGPERHANVESLAEVFRKCETLFMNVKYKYEFDMGEVHSEEEESDLEDSDVSDDNIKQVNHQKRRFDHAQYLRTFVERIHHPLKAKLGDKFAEIIWDRQKHNQLRSDMVRTIYLQRLRVEKRLHDLSWDIPRKKRLFFKNKEPIVHGTYMQKRRSQALHGSLGITADEFLAHV